MGFWQRLFRGGDGVEQKGVYEKWLEMLAGADGKSRAGRAVNWQNALEVATVLSCVRVISEGVAQVPFKVFRKTPTGRFPAEDHPLYPLLHRRPNAWQSSFDFRQTMTMHAAMTGRGCAYINRLPDGTIGELLPIEPARLRVKLDERMRRVYTITLDDGQALDVDASRVWHINGPSWNGWNGFDVVNLARDAIGLAMATEESHSSLHAKGVRPSGVYSVDGALSAQQHEQLIRVLQKYAGAENAGKPMVIDRGAKWISTALNGVDAQHLETRKHQIEEICRAFRVLPIMVGHADKTATYASAEQMFLAHVVHTLAPWYERIEQSAENALLSETDRQAGYYIKFLPAGLLRGAAKDRGEFYAKALGSGGSPAWMTQDEVRELEELNPMGGDAAQLPKPSNVPGVPDDGSTDF